jgi:hypothetical protein
MVLDDGDFHHEGSAFEVEIKRTVVHVDGADRRDDIIGDEHLFVDEARGVLVNLATGFKQVPIVASGDMENRFFIGDMRGENPDIDPAFGGVRDRVLSSLRPE